MIYEQFTTEFGVKLIKRTDESGLVSFIPMDEANSDYQRYLEEQANDQSL